MSSGSNQVTAAIVREPGSFQLGDAMLEAPRDDEMLVHVVATGWCRTDLVVRDEV
jgi:Zn-dependent alcohol dehydrogenase